MRDPQRVARRFQVFVLASGKKGHVILRKQVVQEQEIADTPGLEALAKLGVVATRVLRDGRARMVPAQEVVPGDLVIFDSGDVVSADIRLIESARLQADESALTGESLPVAKSIETLDADTSLLDRRNMLFKGTAITRGTGTGVVSGTGLNTEFGRIFQLVAQAEPQRTPLEKRLDALGNRLAWAVIALAVLLAAAGVLAGRDVYLAIEVAIALAVAAIPEGLPVVATIALARGMWRMATHKALISRLSAVETLGATSVILTDKTGTLTENRMTVTAVRTASATFERSSAHGRLATADPAAGDPELDALLSGAVLCCNAALPPGVDTPDAGIGDPMEIALLVAAARHGLRREDLLARFPELREVAFDPAMKRMATLHQAQDQVLVAVKGAPESVVPLCTTFQAGDGQAAMDDVQRAAWLETAHGFGAQGLRTLAVSSKSTASADTDPYAGLCLLGIVGLEDPPREGIAEAIACCADAGIAVVMVTGDHAATARHIATSVGLLPPHGDDGMLVSGNELDACLGALPADDISARVFSRVTPEQKLALIDLFQQRGNVVGMTGDGVNDAPALKKADIGIAMGIRGTAVAKEAAAMVLLDDDFGTIVKAVEDGRTIFNNIRKFVIYLLSCNISEVLVVTLATVAGAPLPLLPLQILFLNLVTDVFPALALGVGPSIPGIMNRKPRPAGEPVLTSAQWWRVVLGGLVIASTVLAAMAGALVWLEADETTTVTISFCTLAFAQLWHVFDMREDPRRPLRNEISRNPWVWSAMVLCTILVLSAVYIPLLASVLKLTGPGTAGWLLIALFSIVPVLISPLTRSLTDRLGTFHLRRVR
jgi:Ca2+-transporting ATPase